MTFFPERPRAKVIPCGQNLPTLTVQAAKAHVLKTLEAGVNKYFPNILLEEGASDQAPTIFQKARSFGSNVYSTWERFKEANVLIDEQGKKFISLAFKAFVYSASIDSISKFEIPVRKGNRMNNDRREEIFQSIMNPDPTNQKDYRREGEKEVAKRFEETVNFYLTKNA